MYCIGEGIEAYQISMTAQPTTAFTLFLLILVMPQTKYVSLANSGNKDADILTFPKFSIFLWKVRKIVTFKSATSEVSKSEALEKIYREKALYINSTLNAAITLNSQTFC